MIRSMVYVACNGCGDPAGGNDSFADTAAEARAIAKRNGFTRVRVDGKLQDRCPKCAAGDRKAAAERDWNALQQCASDSPPGVVPTVLHCEREAGHDGPHGAFRWLTTWGEPDQANPDSATKKG